MRREQLEKISVKAMRIAGIVFFVVIVAFPFYWMLVSSLKSLEEILLKPANLGLDIRRVSDQQGKVDESFVVAEAYEDLLVFGPDNPRPQDAVNPNTPLP